MNKNHIPAGNTVIGDETESREEALADLRHRERGNVAIEVGRTLRTFCACLTVGFVAYFLNESVKALAGERTDANILVNFFAGFDISFVMAWTAGAGGMLYGWRERKLRQDTIERLQKRIKELELVVDKKRSSSNLTTRGETNPKDA